MKKVFFFRLILIGGKFFGSNKSEDDDKMKNKIIIISVLMVMVFGSFNYLYSWKKINKDKIQLAILLDTSGSMQGLIEQAKNQLWKIVNELATAKRDCKSPDLEVALYEYGKSTIPESEGYMRMIVPLTDDLDRISEELFKLRTNGGSEYCGKVIDSAVKELNWNKDNDDYKVIFIAGNEPFTQGQVDFRKACKNAVSKGIIVNTIFCGDYKLGIITKWKEGADLSDGKYMNINHNRKVVYIITPYDNEIVKLGIELNKTYIGYGIRGSVYKKRQEKQDKNATSVNPEVMVQRAMTKSSKIYKNSSWDMVDAQKEGKLNIERIKKEELPNEMKKMTLQERKDYLKKKKIEREKIQTEIKALKIKRNKYIANKRKNKVKEITLDSVIINAVKTQAEKKKFKFKKEQD